MRQWPHPNMTKFKCPVCKTSSDAPVVLVPIPGTECDGICEAKQVHAECYRVVMRMHGVKVEVEEE